MRSRTTACIALLVLLSGCLGLARAYAPYFHGHNVATSCFDHPSKTIKGHHPPANDPLTAITVSSAGKAVTGLCPGNTYEIAVSFGGSASRAALVTVSQGTLVESNVARCSNSLTTNGKQLVKSLKASWQISCGMMGRVEVKVTSGTSATGKLLKAQLGLPILRLSQCPVNKCTPAAAAAAVATPAVNPPPPAAPRPAAAAAVTELAPSTVASSIAAAAPATLSLSSSSTCESASKLGYQCSKEVARGVTIHYSLGGTPPDNACTKKSTYDERLAGAQGSVLHLAIDSELDGYVALGFPSRPGHMVPADAVIGSIEDVTRVTQVGTYRLVSPSAEGVQPSTAVWATGLGVVRKFNLTTNSHTTTVCFSRPAVTTAAVASSNINPAVVSLIWAAHTSNEFTTHARQGSLTINMVSGKAFGVSTRPRHSSSAAVAHGILMCVAFFLLMPAALLVARHKWLCGNEATGQLSRTWFHLHTALQTLASASIIAGFVLAMITFYPANGQIQGIHKLYTPHFGLGVTVVAFSMLQIVLGLLQPKSGDAKRPLTVWKVGHHSLGWTTWLLGTVNCFLGVILIHDLKHIGGLVTWLVPLCVMLGILLLGGMIMEVPKHMLQSQGCYNPETHTFQPQRLDLGPDEKPPQSPYARHFQATAAFAAVDHPTRRTSDRTEYYSVYEGHVQHGAAA